MSSTTWTPAALSSEARPRSGEAWRLVEAQHKVSTMKLTDTLDEQAVLERLVEATKPRVPEACAHLHFLLSAPFRYQPYPFGSRFRKSGFTPGVFYAAEEPRTAVAEMAFYRLLFFAESPDTPWPANPAEYTAFAAAFATESCIDLTVPPFEEARAAWMHPVDYAACHSLEEAARAAGIECIRYRSVRDPAGGANIAILRCEAFAQPQPVAHQTWRLFLDRGGVRATCEFPPSSLSFDRDTFAADPRLAGMRWVR